MLLVLFNCSSCMTGIVEVARGRDKYVIKNNNGREELIKKKYQSKFEPAMADALFCDKVYYNYYENSNIGYINHSFLRFFKTGQFAYFYSESGNVDVNDINHASFVGYYVTEGNIVKLETPKGNFNTAHFRMVWKYSISDDKLHLISSKHGNIEFAVRDSIVVVDVKPNW